MKNEEMIKELEEIKAEFKIHPYETAYTFKKNMLKIIDEHIAKLKGENE